MNKQEYTNKGTTVLVDYFGVATEKFNRPIMEAKLKEFIEASDVQILSTDVKHFGHELAYTLNLVLSASSLSLHTWHESNYISLDITICNDIDPTPIVNKFTDWLNADWVQGSTFERGVRYEQNTHLLYPESN